MSRSNSLPILVSISCITYNQVEYIRQCITSLIEQKTSFLYEILIHDDASTDGTSDVIREFSQKYPDIVKPIIQKENQYSQGKGFVGLEINTQRAIGKYIAVCEGDDYWIDPLKLQKQFEYMETHPICTCVFTGRYVECENKGIRIKQTYKERIYSKSDILSGFNPGLQNAMFSKFAIDQPLISGINGDRLYPYFASLRGEIHVINDVTAVYRLTGKGVSSKIEASKRLKYSTNDFYVMHKILGFPSKRAWLKGESRYLSDYLKNNGGKGIVKAFKLIREVNSKCSIIDYVYMLCYSVVKMFLNKNGLGDIKNVSYPII